MTEFIKRPTSDCKPSPYVGRFAPSPTGPLHFGSLVAAVASYLEARTRSGRWLLRIEDIDPPREQAGAAEQIVDTLERYGFRWDGEVIFQSRSLPDHQEALRQLERQNMTYACRCSRRDLSDLPRSTLGIVYPGFCRDRNVAGDAAIRVRTDDSPIEFEDVVQGMQSSRLEGDSGDFVVQRRDGLIAYQLAVVVDDERQGITDVVRGTDLLDSTPRQIWLQRLLAFRSIRYAHIPVVVHDNGDKLSKLTGAPGIAETDAQKNLFKALVALKQRPPQSLRAASLLNIWSWAHHNWRINRLFGNKSVSAHS